MIRGVVFSISCVALALLCACEDKPEMSGSGASSHRPSGTSVSSGSVSTATAPRASSAAATAIAPTPVGSSSATPAASSAPEANAVFPLVEGTKYTFRGKRPDGSDDTWTAVLFVIDSSKRLFQYDPHNHVASWFTKAGIKVDSSGIQVVGESLAGDPAPEPALAVAFPITKGAGHEVPGLFVTKYTIAKKESVTVPAGKFEAWKVTIQDKVNPEGAAWLAPGTGLVKIQLPSGRVDELVSVEPAKR